MAKVIDANELKNKLLSMRKWFDGPVCTEQDKLARAVVKMCIEEIDKQKPVDDPEVVHANWDNNGICTMCGYPIPTDSKYDFIDKDDCLFCYHCGAKMDGGNEDVPKAD